MPEGVKHQTINKDKLIPNISAPNIISMTPGSIYLKSFKNKYTPNIINTILIINITSIPTPPFRD